MSTIPYDRPIEDMIAGLDETKHVSHQTATKTSVTLHHNDGVRVSHQGVLDTWKTREASAHFDVDYNGAIAQYVIVNQVAWGVGNWAGNVSTISIEMADADSNFTISEATIASATRLAAWLFVHVIKARPAPSNFFPHQHWSATDCPGPWVMRNWSSILASVQKLYDEMTGQQAHVPTKLSVIEIAHQVIEGMWGNGGERVTRLRAAGYVPELVQAEVNLLLHQGGTNGKTISQLAHEVINGEWGNDPERSRKLTAAGYNAHEVQLAVNHILG